MHVRVAPARGGPRLGILRGHRVQGRSSILLVTVVACCLAAGCHRAAPARNLVIDWRLAPSPPAVGPAVLTFRVFDSARHAVPGARLRVEAQMSHPGMAPVLATAAERATGVYEADLQFTMSGDWILIVAGSLSSGEAVQYRIDVPDVRSPAGKSADASS